MTKPLLLLLAALPLPAAVLQCVVLDYDSGRPLARSIVTVEGVQGGQSLSRNTVRTDRYGVAKIAPLSDGAYLVTVSREAFATQQYGQTGWNRPGIPLSVQGDRPIGVEIRLRRLPSISGIVWDENQIGIPNAPVVVYTGTRPAKLVTKTVTDDRGFYRLGGLVPGTYVVRNAAKQFDDALSIVPTFYPDGNQLSQARTIEIDLDHSAQDVNFSPAQGRLFRVSGRVQPYGTMPPGVELVSDTGRVSTNLGERGSFSFEAVAPGTYDLFTQNQANSRGFGAGAAWVRIRVDRDSDDLSLQMQPLMPVTVRLAANDGAKVDPAAANLFARRKDLDADGPVIPVQDRRALLAPGNWEIAVSTAPNYYPAAVGPITTGRADGWNPFTAAAYPVIAVTLSPRPASLRGRVAFSANNPAPQVPVFLETLDTNPEEPPQVRTTRTDQFGNYAFTGLPPGRYAVVSSYDADPTSRNSLELARPKTVSLQELANETQDLEIYVH